MPKRYMEHISKRFFLQVYMLDTSTGTNIKRQWFHFCINENFKDGGNSTTDSIKVLHLKSNTHKQGDKSDN